MFPLLLALTRLWPFPLAASFRGDGKLLNPNPFHVDRLFYNIEVLPLDNYFRFSAAPK